MREYTIIVPKCYDDTKFPVEPEKFEQLSEKLLDFAGGYTVGRCIGAWRDELGQTVRDESITYTFAVNKFAHDAIECVHKLAIWVCEEFHQQCVYVSSGGRAVLVSPGRSADAIRDNLWNTGI